VQGGLGSGRVLTRCSRKQPGACEEAGKSCHLKGTRSYHLKGAGAPLHTTEKERSPWKSCSTE
jgi:hypothetical protein